MHSLVSRLTGRDRWNSEQDQKSLVAEAKVIFDVGAHLGQSSEVYLRLYPRAQIWAFEPTPATFALLQSRFAKRSRVHPMNLALSDKQGEEPFHLAAGSQVNSMLASNRKVETINVKTDTVDLFCAGHSIQTIDILKVDVEGMEARLFEGASGMFRRKAVRLVLTEVYFRAVYEGMRLFWDLHRQLEGYGFRLFGLYSLARSADRSLEFGNALYQMTD